MDPASQSGHYSAREPGRQRRIRARMSRDSSHLPTIEASLSMNPVTLPPGRGKLATKPEPTGSVALAKMMGMVRVCCSSAAVVGVLDERTSSGLQRDKFLRESLHRLLVGRRPT